MNLGLLWRTSSSEVEQQMFSLSGCSPRKRSRALRLYAPSRPTWARSRSCIWPVRPVALRKALRWQSWKWLNVSLVIISCPLPG
jgi:hypothetical protein